MSVVAPRYIKGLSAAPILHQKGRRMSAVAPLHEMIVGCPHPASKRPKDVCSRPRYNKGLSAAPIQHKKARRMSVVAPPPTSKDCRLPTSSIKKAEGCLQPHPTSKDCRLPLSCIKKAEGCLHSPRYIKGLSAAPIQHQRGRRMSVVAPRYIKGLSADPIQHQKGRRMSVVAPLH